MKIEHVASKLIHNSKVSCFISVTWLLRSFSPCFRSVLFFYGQELIFSRLAELLFTHHNFLT